MEMHHWVSLFLFCTIMKQNVGYSNSLNKKPKHHQQHQQQQQQQQQPQQQKSTSYEAEFHITTDSKNQKTVSKKHGNPPLEEWCEFMHIASPNCTCPLLDSLVNETICQYYVTVSTLPTSECVTKYILAIKVILVMLFSILGILGNAHVIILRLAYWNHTPHCLLIVGLSTADLCFSIASLLDIVLELYSPCTWVYGVFMCKTLHTMMALSLYVDLGFILIISIERYMGIVHPFNQYRFSKLRTKQIILANVIVSSLLVVPFYLQYNVGRDLVCKLQWNSRVQFVYTWILFVMFFLFPILLTSYLSFKSVRALQQTICEHHILSAMDENSRSRIIAENRKIMRILGFVLLAFVILVLPNHLVWMVIVTVKKIPSTLYHLMGLFAILPYSLHASINPIIYSMLDKRYRKYSKDVFLCRKSQPNNCDLSIRNRFISHEDKELTTNL